MPTTVRFALGVCLCLTVSVSAQSPKSGPDRLRDYGLAEAPGSVPVFFVPEAKERALRLQKSMQASHAWYEKQFDFKVPVVLGVVDNEKYSALFGLIGTRQVPTRDRPRLVAMAAHMEGAGSAGSDADHGKGGVLQGEHIVFHDDGHAFFDALKIGDVGIEDVNGAGLYAYNRSVVEFIASVFTVAYIRSERPDLAFFLKDRRTGRPNPPRFATLADFDYLDGKSGYFWFMFQMERMADALLERHPDFVGGIRKAKLAFQDQSKPEPPESILARFEKVWPGFTEIAGPLAGPSTIPIATPSAFQESAPNAKMSRIVIQNDTEGPVIILRQKTGGAEDVVRERSWRTFNVLVGASLILPGGKCITAEDGPTRFVIGKN